jgi:ATP-dependent DNA helicase RecG
MKAKHIAHQLELPLFAPARTLPQLWTPEDVFEACSEDIIRSFSEDSRVERKLATVSQKTLSEVVSMWANTQPYGGVTFIGVADDGTIKGCVQTEQKHLNDLEAVRERCPDARVTFKRVPVLEGTDYVLAMRVFYREDKLVETTEGGAFIREGDRKRRLTEAEKQEIRANKGEISVESEPAHIPYPEGFDEDLIALFRESFIEKRSLPDRYSTEDILKLAKLGDKRPAGFQANLAGALLFARDPRSIAPGAYVRVLRYEGSEERFGRQLNAVADRVFEGPVPLVIVDATRFIDAQIRTFVRLGPDGRFASTPEYPREVWQEALVNALVHRSYNLRNMNVFVKIFEDKFVVESPGSFLPPTTAETVYEGHNPRNPNLMWRLYYFDFVQCGYEGTRRMRDGMRRASLPDPVFVQQQSGTFKVTVTLENDAAHRKQFVRADAIGNMLPTVYESLTQEEKMLVNYLADQDRVNVTDAGLVIGCDWRKTKSVLDSLEKKKLIVRTPGKFRSRHRFYYLSHKIRPLASRG